MVPDWEFRRRHFKKKHSSLLQTITDSTEIAAAGKQKMMDLLGF